MSAANLSMVLLMASSLMALILEALSNRKLMLLLIDRPHIRLLTIGALMLSIVFFTRELINNAELSARPHLFFGDITALFLLINTLIAVLLSRQTLKIGQDGETYFLVLASTALAITNVCSSSIMINFIATIAFMASMTALCVRTTQGGKKAEVGLKLAFSTVILLLQFTGAITILLFHGQPLTLDPNDINALAIFSNTLGLAILLLVGLALTSTPPFHFGYVDCADGGDISIAFLLLSNSYLQGCAILFRINHIFNSFDLNGSIPQKTLSIFLIIGFMISWLRALDQSRIRRTIAYIAISVGPLLSLAMLFGTSVLLPKLIYFLATFSFVTLSLFTIFGSFAYMSEINSPLHTWEDLAGYGRKRAQVSTIFFLGLLSIAGIPGTLGYFLKLSLIAPFKDSPLVSGAIFLSIAFGAACCLRIFVFMFSKHSHLTKFSSVQLKMPFTLAISALLLLGLGFFPFVR